MTAQFVFDVDVSQTLHVTSELEDKLSPAGLTGFLTGTVAPYLRSRARNRFASEGDSSVGGKWDPLSPNTVKIREALGFPGAHPINKRTGQLEAFITQNRGVLATTADMAVLTFPNEPGLGEIADKFELAQKGSGSWKSENPIPARPVIGLDETDMLFVTAELMFFVEGAP